MFYISFQKTNRSPKELRSATLFCILIIIFWLQSSCLCFFFHFDFCVFCFLFVLFALFSFIIIFVYAIFAQMSSNQFIVFFSVCSFKMIGSHKWSIKVNNSLCSHENKIKIYPFLFIFVSFHLSIVSVKQIGRESVHSMKLGINNMEFQINCSASCLFSLYTWFIDVIWALLLPSHCIRFITHFDRFADCKDAGVNRCYQHFIMLLRTYMDFIRT